MTARLRLGYPPSLALAFVLWAGFASGPAFAQSGAWSSGGPVGGNVYCLAVDPAVSSTLYAGTDQGVFKSMDAGATWKGAFSGMPSSRVQAIAVDPTAPDILYAGTVTPGGVPSIGIFKSTDGAATWTLMNGGLIDPVTGISPLDVAALAIDPHNPQRILAGTRFSEIFLSTDGAATWSAQTFGGFNVGLEVSDLKFDPSNSSTVYAASTLGLLKSTDGGMTWNQFGNAGVTFFALAIDPASPQIVYAANSDGFGIFKSINGGAAWVTVNHGLPVIPGGAGSGLPLALALALDPAHPGTLYAGTYGNGIFRSTDSAATWSDASAGLRTPFVAALTFASTQNATLFAATLGGGVSRSVDGATTWAPDSAGLDLGLVFDLVSDPAAPHTLYASTFDGAFRSPTQGASWEAIDNGLPSSPVAALALAAGSPATLFAGTLGSGLFASSDGGATWSASMQGLSATYISSLAVDPAAPSTLYAGTAQPTGTKRVFKSIDRGVTWTQTSLNAGSASVDFLAVNPSNSAQVVAGSRGAASFFQSTDAGQNWSSVSVSSSCGAVNGVVLGGSGGTLLLAGTAGVCRSADGGKTWTAGALGGYAASVVAIDPSNPEVLYAGTVLDVGSNTAAVFRSTDAGQSWQKLGADFPSATVNALVVDPSENVLHAATFGAGVAELFLAVDREPIQTAPAANHSPRVIAPR